MESGVAADSDDISLTGLHSDTTDHRKVWLVHWSADCMDAVSAILVTDTPPQDERRVDRALVPATIQQYVSLIEWDSSDVTHLLGHLDRKNQPFGSRLFEVEFFD